MLHEAQSRYEAGTILRLIADDLGVSRQRLAVRLCERGVTIRGEGPRWIARGFRNHDNYRLRMLLIGGGLNL